MKVFLNEDHDEVLKIWRKSGIKGLDLVHVDAHIDFVLHHARAPKDILAQAKNIDELKKNLEYTLCYLNYEKNLDRQTDIGNYIYPAMVEGIVGDFYWVVPGSAMALDRNHKWAQRIIRNVLRDQKIKLTKKSEGLYYLHALERNFYICTLESLPVFTNPVLLDIDTDFMVVENINKADNTCDIGKRKAWIKPEKLNDTLLAKIKKPVTVTIVYSTNDGFTPMNLRYLGDELAYGFAPLLYKRRYKKALIAHNHFDCFCRLGQRVDYFQAVRLDRAYRKNDNNYGPLYLQKNKLLAAKKEFNRILAVDPQNPYCLLNMGMVALEEKEHTIALTYLTKALRGLKGRERLPVILNIAETYFRLKRLDKAEKLFLSTIKPDGLNGLVRRRLGDISALKKNFNSSADYYRQALQLGINDLAIMRRLLTVALKLGRQKKADIIDYIDGRLRGWNKDKKYARQIWQLTQRLKKVKIS